MKPFEKELRRTLARLSLGHWRVIVEEDRGLEHMGRTAVDASACFATVSYNPDHHPNRAELLDTARHEAIHVLLSRYRRAARDNSPDLQMIEEDLVLQILRFAVQ